MKDKKILYGAFVLLACLMVGCVKQTTVEKPDVKENNVEKSTEKVVKKKSKEKSKEKKTKDKTVEITGLPHIILEEIDESRFDTETGGLKYQIKSVKLRLKEEDDGFEALREAFEKYNTEVDENIENLYTEMDRWYDYVDKDEYDGNIRMDTESYAVRADKSVVSLLNYTYVENNIGDPWYSYGCKNFDTSTGKEIELSDVIKDEQKFYELADAGIKENYPNEDLTSPSKYAKEIENDDFEDIVWTISPEGVTLYFDSYVLDPEIPGNKNVTVYFDEADIFNEKYVNKEADFVYPIISNGMIANLDIDEDGKREEVYVNDLKRAIKEDEGIYLYGLEAFIDGESAEAYGYNGEAYIVKKDGKYYMYMFVEEESGAYLLYKVDTSSKRYDIFYDEETFGLPVVSKGMTYTMESNIHTSLKEALTDPDSFIGGGEANLLRIGVVYQKEWYIGEDAMPKPKDDRYKIVSGNIQKLLDDVEWEEIDENGMVKQLTKIPKDTYILLNYTNAKDLVDVKIVDKKYVEEEDIETFRGKYRLKDGDMSELDGDEFRIHYENEYGVIKIDGINVLELFEGMENN